MPGDPRTLIAEARKVVADCERHLEAAVEFVRALPTDRELVLERVATAEERLKRAREEWHRLRDDEDVDEWKLKEAEREYDRAASASFRLRWYDLASDDIIPSTGRPLHARWRDCYAKIPSEG